MLDIGIDHGLVTFCSVIDSDLFCTVLFLLFIIGLRLYYYGVGVLLGVGENWGKVWE